MDHAPPEPRTFIIAFDESLPSDLLAVAIGRLGQSLRLFPNVFAVTSRRAPVEIGEALRPFTKLPDSPDQPRKLLFVIEVNDAIWEKGLLSVDIDLTLQVMLKGRFYSSVFGGVAIAKARTRASPSHSGVGSPCSSSISSIVWVCSSLFSQ